MSVHIIYNIIILIIILLYRQSLHTPNYTVKTERNMLNLLNFFLFIFSFNFFLIFHLIFKTHTTNNQLTGTLKYITHLTGNKKN